MGRGSCGLTEVTVDRRPTVWEHQVNKDRVRVSVRDRVRDRVVVFA